MKKQDVVFYEHILGHPSLANVGLTIGYNILGEPISVSDQLSSSDLDCSIPLDNPPIPDTHVTPNPSTALIATSEPDIWVQGITGGKAYTLNQEIWHQYLLQHPTFPLPDTDSFLTRYTSHFHSLLSKLGVPSLLPVLSTALPEDDPTS